MPWLRDKLARSAQAALEKVLGAPTSGPDLREAPLAALAQIGSLEGLLCL